MSTILIDLSYINSEQKKKESVALYALRVLDGFKKNNLVGEFHLLVSEEMLTFFQKEYADYKLIIYPKYNKLLASIPYIKGIYKMLVWKFYVDKIGYSMIYLPFSWTGNSSKVRAKKIITIHDLKPIRKSNSAFTNSNLFKNLRINHLLFSIVRNRFGRMLKNSSQIIAISNYVKEDILKVWPQLATNNIVTVYNGVVLSEHEKETDLIIDYPYILFVNSLNQYKNISTLVDAYTLIISEIEHKLVVVGKTTDYWKQIVFNMSPEVRERLIHIDYVSNECLRWLYNHASLFVTTSTKEGFGYTPIEAAICKCPVISTLSESLPEVTRNCLLYYNPPSNVNELSILLIRTLNSPPTPDKLQEISDIFSKEYNNNTQSYKIYELIKHNYAGK